MSYLNNKFNTDELSRVVDKFLKIKIFLPDGVSCSFLLILISDFFRKSMN